MFLMTHLHTFILQDPTSVLGGGGVDWAMGMKCLGARGRLLLRPPPPPKTGTRTMHEAKLQRLPHGEVIEKLVSIAVPDTAAEFLPDARQAA